MKKEYPDILKLEGEKWHNPDPATGKLGTRVPAEWLQTTEDSLKSLTLEMLEVLKAAGINPNELNNTQVRDAIQKILLNNSTSTLSDRTDQVATIKVVNDVNRSASTAQKTANTANDKANAAQTRADSAYNLANSKQDKLTFAGTGDVARMSEVEKKRNITDNSFFGSLLSLKRSADDKAYVGLHASSDGRHTITSFSDAGDFHSFIPNKTGTIAHTSDIPQLTSTLSDREDLAATPKAVNAVNKEVNKKRNITDNSFFGSLLSLKRSADDKAYVALHASSDGRHTITSFSDAGDFHSFIPNKTGTIVHTSDVLGIGQKWVDVTSSRVVETIYTNNTGSPIFVYVTGDLSSLEIFIDGIKIGHGGQETNVIAVPIPPNSKYLIKVLGAKSLKGWAELR